MKYSNYYDSFKNILNGIDIDSRQSSVSKLIPIIFTFFQIGIILLLSFFYTDRIGRMGISLLSLLLPIIILNFYFYIGFNVSYRIEKVNKGCSKLFKKSVLLYFTIYGLINFLFLIEVVHSIRNLVFINGMWVVVFLFISSYFVLIQMLKILIGYMQGRNHEL
ncbi:hypothetical protein GKR75_08130 [Providencia sp. wls1919]|nr:hypothetical protein [Providencia sp. wls1919]